MRILNLPLLIFGAMLSTSGCLVATPESIPTAPTPFKEFTLPQVTPNPQCAPPCFYGLVPGKTSQAEALTLLGASPAQLDGRTLYWNSISGRANYIVFEKEVVRNINLVEELPEISFQDIVERYGDPEAVIISRPAVELFVEDIVLTYPSQGLAFLGRYWGESELGKAFTPMPDILVEKVIYFGPRANGDLSDEDAAKLLSIDWAEVRPWRGFGVSHYEP